MANEYKLFFNLTFFKFLVKKKNLHHLLFWPFFHKNHQETQFETKDTFLFSYYLHSRNAGHKETTSLTVRHQRKELTFFFFCVMWNKLEKPLVNKKLLCWANGAVLQRKKLWIFRVFWGHQCFLKEGSHWSGCCRKVKHKTLFNHFLRSSCRHITLWKPEPQSLEVSLMASLCRKAVSLYLPGETNLMPPRK